MARPTRYLPCLFVLLAAGAAGAALSAQTQQPPPPPASTQKPPVFRGGTNLVTVDAYPTHGGRVIEGLTKDDFEIFEDGKPQAVQTLDFIPADAPLSDEERPSYLSSREGLALASDPRYRVTVIVLDRAAFAAEAWGAIRDALIDFLHTSVDPRDLIDIITTDQAWQNLSLGRRLSVLEAELDNPEWLRPAATEDTLALANCGVDMVGPRIRAEATYNLLEGIVRLLGQAREDRSSVVFVSNGLTQQGPDKSNSRDMKPLKMPPRVGLVNGKIQRVPSASDMHDAFCKREVQRLRDTDFARRFAELTTLARASNVAFHPIALPAMVFGLDPQHAMMAGRSMMPAGAPRRGDAPFGRGSSMSMRMRGFGSDSLGTLAAQTGGLAVIPARDAGEGLRRVVADAGPHYLLGYATSNAKRDGKIRTIKVRLKKDGTEIRARKWYRAPTNEDVKDVKAAPPPGPVERIVPGPIAAALAPLLKARPSAQFFAYGALAGKTVNVTLEVPAPAVEAGRWSDGAALDFIVETADGEMLGMAQGRLARNGRASAQVPIDGAKTPSVLLVRLRADGETITERSAVGLNPSTLAGDPLAYRSSSRGLAVPVASFLFESDEKLRLDWPLLAPIDRFEARLLDRYGEQLKMDVGVESQEMGGGRRRLEANITLAPLGRGDYVLELTVGAGTITERKLLAFRVR